MFVIDFPINTTLSIILYSFIYHIHHDMFRPVTDPLSGSDTTI